MKKTSLILGFMMTMLLCLSTSLLAQNSTMSFDSGASEPGFTFYGWSDGDGEIWMSNLGGIAKISKNAGLWNISSFQVVSYYGNNKMKIESNLGDSHEFDTDASRTITLNWTDISSVTFSRISGSDSSSGLDNFVYSGSSITAPNLSTNPITTYSSISATMGGEISDDGGATVTARGVVYSVTGTNSNPEIGGTGVTKDVNNSGLTNFSENIGSLSSGTNYSIQAYATNAAGTRYGGVENFSTLPDQAPHVANALSDLIKNEDFTAIELELSEVFSDIDSPDENISIAILDNNNTSLLDASITEGILYLTSNLNQNGVAVIQVRATSNGLTVDDDFSVTVNPINDAPTIDLPSSFTFAEDGQLVVDLTDHTNDVDFDDLTLTVSGNTKVYALISGLNVTFTAMENWYGTETLTFTVNDNIGRAVASDDVDIIVTPVDDPEVCTLNPEISGLFQVNETLAVTEGTWNDDLDEQWNTGENQFNPSYTYQWEVSEDGEIFEEIESAYTSDFMVPDNFESKYVRSKIICENLEADTEFRYDDGIATAQLGFSASPSAVLGGAHFNNAIIHEVSWLLTSEAYHAEATIYIFGLDDTGMPDTSDLLHQSSPQPNVDDSWNTYSLPSPLETPNGFFLGVCTPNIFTALGTDDGVGAPYEFQSGTQLGIADWTAGNNWLDIGPAGYPFNFTIRAKGENLGELSFASRERIANNGNSGLIYSRLENPINPDASRTNDTSEVFAYSNTVQIENTLHFYSIGDSDYPAGSVVPHEMDEDTIWGFDLTVKDFNSSQVFSWEVQNELNGTVEYANIARDASLETRPLVFTPDQNYYGPAGFSITTWDSNNVPAQINFDITVIAVNDIPTITEAAGEWETTDKESIMLFGPANIDDIDLPLQEIEVELITDNPGAGYFTDQLGNVVTSFSGTHFEVTEMLRSLIFVPIENHIAAYETEIVNITLSIMDEEEGSAFEEDISVEISSMPDPPVISGSIGVRTINDFQHVAPFQNLEISDVDFPMEILHAVIIISDLTPGTMPAGVMTHLNGFAFTDEFTLEASGTYEELTYDFRHLIYEPILNLLAPEEETQVQFDIRVTDPTELFDTDDTNILIIRSDNDDPEISGILEVQEIPDVEAVMPFAGVELSDVDPEEILAITVATLNPQLGSFNSLVRIRVATDELQFSGTAEECSHFVQQLVYLPVENMITPGETIPALINLVVEDSNGGSAKTTVTLDILSMNDEPSLTGTQQFVNVPDDSTIYPFSSTIFSDIDNPAQILNITIECSNPEAGDLSEMSFSGTTEELNTWIQTVSFAVTPDRLSPGATEDLHFIVNYNDGVCEDIVDETTLAQIIGINDLPEISGITAQLEITDKESLMPFAEVTISDPDNQPVNLTVTLDTDIFGYVSQLNGFSQNGNILSLNGVRTEVITALNGVEFTPYENLYPVGQTEDVNFALAVTEMNDNRDVVYENTNVTILSVNDAPVALDDEEDLSAGVNVVITDLLYNDSDVDGDALTIQLAGLTSNLGVNLVVVNNVVDYQIAGMYTELPAGESLEDSFTYTLSDGNGGSDSATVTIIITGINDAPAANSDDITLNEDETVTLTVIANDTDVDSELDGSSIQIMNVPSELEVIILADGELQITPIENINGNFEFNYTVADMEGMESNSATVNVEINPINDAPQISAPTIVAPASLVMIEDIAESFPITYGDVDNSDEELYLFANVISGEFQAVILDDIVTITPAENWSGEAELLLRISDGMLHSDLIVTLVVQPADEVITLSLPAEIVIAEDETETLDFSSFISEADGMELSLVVVESENIEVEISGFNVEFSTAPNWNGNEELTFQILDGAGTVLTEDNLNLIFTPVNDLPVLAGEIVIEMLEDSPIADYDLDLLFSDIDEDDLSYEILESAYLIIVQTGSHLEITPDHNWFGYTNISLTVFDGTDYVTEEITVIVTPVNDAPLFDLPETLSMEEGGTIRRNLAPFVSDIDSSNLTYSIGTAENLSLELNGSNLVIACFDEEYYGETEVTLTVSDGLLSTTDTITIIVEYLNDAPVYIGETVVNLEEDFGSFEYAVLTELFHDVDPEEFTNLTVEYAIANDQLCEVSTDSGTLSFTSIENACGITQLILIACDNDSYPGSAAQTTTVNVILNILPVNDAPLLSGVPSMLDIPFNGTFNLELSSCIADVDNSELDVTLTDESGNLIISENGNYLFILNSENSVEMSGSILLTVNDGDDTATATINYQIGENEAPVVIQQIPNMEFLEDFSDTLLINLNDFFSHPAGHQLGFSADIGEGRYRNDIISCSVDSDNYLHLSANLPNWSGSATVTVTCTDLDLRYSVSQEFGVEILAVNDEPIIVNQPGIQHQSEDFEMMVFPLGVIFLDVDDEFLSFSVMGNAEQLQFEIRNDSLLVSPQANWSGSSAIVVTANDGSSATGTSCEIEFEVASVYDYPLFLEELEGSIVNISITGSEINLANYLETFGEDEAASFVYHLDGEDVYYEISSSEDDPYNLHITPLGNQWGYPNQSCEFVIAGGSRINLMLTANNAPYILTTIPDLEIQWFQLPYPNSEVDWDNNLNSYFADPEGNELIYEAIYDVDAVALTIDENGYLLIDSVGDPIFIGTTEVTIIASDDTGENSCSQNFLITILPEEVFEVVAGETVEFELNSRFGRTDSTSFALDKASAICEIRGDKLVVTSESSNIVEERVIIELMEGELITQRFCRVLFTESRAKSDVPVANLLIGNYPNPFNPTTTFSYELKEAALVEIVVFNSKGQLVKSLVNQNQTAGSLSAIWNGLDNSGQAVSSGLYLYKLKVNNKNVSMKKCILLK